MQYKDLRKLLPKRLQLPFLVAYVGAIKGPGVGGKKRRSYQLAALLMDGYEPEALRFNSYKTHPKLKKYTEFPHLHAESAVLLFAKLPQTRGRNVIVVRVKKNGDIACAKPCPVCMAIMFDYGVKKCYFTVDNGWDQICIR